jgi:hypothetical protein
LSSADLFILQFLASMLCCRFKFLPQRAAQANWFPDLVSIVVGGSWSCS